MTLLASRQRCHHFVQSLDDHRPLGLRTFLVRTHDDPLLAAHLAKVPRRFKIVGPKPVTKHKRN
jgi:hypothetical protein